MLDEIDATQFMEWMAYWQIKDEEDTRSGLAADAVAGVRNHRRGGR